MRTAQTILTTLVVALLSACGSDLPEPLQPDERPTLNSGYTGTGNLSDSTGVTVQSTKDSDSTTERSPGYVGSGH